MPNGALTRADIVERLYEQMDLTRDEVKKLFDTLIATIRESVIQDHELLISGFGRFNVKHKAPRTGRNPATKKSMTLDERNVVTFSWSKVFRSDLNGADGASHE